MELSQDRKNILEVEIQANICLLIDKTKTAKMIAPKAHTPIFDEIGLSQGVTDFGGESPD